MVEFHWIDCTAAIFVVLGIWPKDTGQQNSGLDAKMMDGVIACHFYTSWGERKVSYKDIVKY
jgi:hypothetical protein